MIKKDLSDRVTVRLSKKMINEMDNIIVIGEYRTRSDIVREAVKWFINSKVKEIAETFEAKEKLQKIAAQTIEAEKAENEYMKS
jgi:hypothetical protein